MPVLTEVTNQEPHSRRCISEKTQLISLRDGPTFYSRIPFQFVRARIYQGEKMLSEVNVEAGSIFQFDPNLLTDETTEFQVLAYWLSNGKECLVGALRGNMEDLACKEIFYLINRVL